MRERTSSTALSSCAAVTVTDCAVFQLVVVNVSVSRDRERGVPPCPVIVTVTLPVGCVPSFTV